MSILSFVKKDKDELAILVDIGSGVVTGSFVFFSAHQKPEVLYLRKFAFPISEEPDSEKLLNDMEKGVSQVLDDVIKNGVKHSKFKRIDKILITFASPWFYTVSKSIKINENKAFLITEEVLRDLITKEAEDFKLEIQKNLDEKTSDSFAVIEHSVVNTKINGYSVGNVIGKKAKNLEADIWMSLIPKSIEDKVLSLVGKYTHIDNKHILAHSFPLVLFSVARDAFLVSDNFLIIDVTSENTLVSLVVNNTLGNSNILPIGRNYLIRKIAKEIGVSCEIAESYLGLYSENKIDLETTNLIDKAVLDVEKEWAIYFEDALISFSPKILVPKTIFVTGESNIKKIIYSYLLIKKEDKTKSWRENLKIVDMDSASLNHLVEYSHLKEMDDFISIESVFYDKKIKQK